MDKYIYICIGNVVIYTYIYMECVSTYIDIVSVFICVYIAKVFVYIYIYVYEECRVGLDSWGMLFRQQPDTSHINPQLALQILGGERPIV